MLPLIVQHAEVLVTFISLLNLALYQPQIRHLLQIVDALLTSNERKTLSNLSRLFKEGTDAKNLADFFRESPWTVDLIGKPRKKFMLQTALELARKAGLPLKILVGIDDSLGKKGKATKHLQAVDYQHNHNESAKNRQVWNNGYVYVEMHVQIGPFSFLFDTQIYLREKKVRHLNRERSADKRLKYRSKYKLAKAMLTELAELLPEDCKVYVLFDSWYASARLINFCLRHKGWHVICAIKSNRRLGKVRVDARNQMLRQKPYQIVKLAAVDDHTPARTYYVRTVQGQIEDVAQEVYVIISKKRPGDVRPKYFLCSDLSLSAEEALSIYQKRWSVEVDNLYLKGALGLGDFRLQSLEATQKWFEVVTLALNYLQYRAMLEYQPKRPLPSLADCKRKHQHAHFQAFLHALVAEVKRCPEQVDAIVQSFLPAERFAAA
jgi:hypothetical protein